MDPEHDVNRNLDHLSRFSLFFPLPYRVAIVLVAGMLSIYPPRKTSSIATSTNSALGVWGWGLNLHYLSAVKIVCMPPIRMGKKELYKTMVPD